MQDAADVHFIIVLIYGRKAKFKTTAEGLCIRNARISQQEERLVLSKVAFSKSAKHGIK